MAVDCITFSWFPDPDTGVLGVVWSVILFAVGTYGIWVIIFYSHDYISGFHAKTSGTKLKTFREWNLKGYDRIVADMMGYAQYIQEHKMNGEEKEVSAMNKPLNYENGPGMLPLLPAEIKGVRGSEVAKSAREIIRSYFQRHYSKLGQFYLIIVFTLKCSSGFG
jgi:hypothetical protein